MFNPTERYSQTPAMVVLGPPQKVRTITPNDDQDLEFVPRVINVSTSGEVSFVDMSGQVDAVYVAAGVWFALACRRIRNTGTDAGTIRVGV